MEYNTSGIRTKRVSEEKTYNYIYAGDKLMRMTVGNDTLDFNYDVNGVPLTMTYNGTVYYYTTNLQGDVISLERADGGGGAQYAYDAWGNIIAMSGTLAELNPLRYRGYIYDQETGFYYVSSRYYDPAIGRFINADDTEYLGADGTLLSYNLYAYCMNNPVNRFEIDGNWSMPNSLKVAVGVVVIVGLAAATAFTGGTAAVIFGAALSGAVAGGASGAVIGAISGGISNGWQGVMDGASSGFMSGTLIGAGTGAASAGINVASGTTIVGKAHGSVLHKFASNLEAGKMAASGKYTQIGMNKALKTMGLNGACRPDVIGISKKGLNKIVEVVSPRQSTTYIQNKTAKMVSQNPGAIGKVISWVRNLFK